jgi:hypothetical protein
MDNPEKLAIFGTQTTGRRQTKRKTKQKHNSENEKDEQRGPHQKPKVNPHGLEGQICYASYKTPSMLTI